MAEYYCDLFDPEKLIKVSDSGEVFSFNIEYLEWLPVSATVMFSPSWMPLSEEDYKISLYCFYLESSISYLEDEDNNLGITDFEAGQEFNFYEVFNRIICVDDKDNQYQCFPNYMQPMTTLIENKEWQALPIEEVWDKIQNQNMENLKDNELYLRPDGHIVCNSPNHGYMLYNYSGELKIANKPYVVRDTWKKIDFSYIENLEGDYETVADVYLLYERHDFYKSLKVLFPDYKKTYKEDLENIRFYKNIYGKVFAKNQHGNEFFFNDREWVPCKTGTVDERWERVASNRATINASYYYAQKELTRNYGSPSLLQLDLFMNMNGDICGIAENGKEYRMDKVSGEIKKVEKGDESPLPHHPVDRKEVWKKQGKLDYYYSFNKYIDDSEAMAKEEGKGEFGKDFTFYGLPDDPDRKVLARDENFNEYYCSASRMIPIAKGNITDAWVPYKDDYVLAILAQSELERNYRMNGDIMDDEDFDYQDDFDFEDDDFEDDDD